MPLIQINVRSELINLDIDGKIKENFEFPFIRVLSYQGKMMKIKTIDIEGIGGIKKLHLVFNAGLNVICGSNGIGKTTILNIITDAFGYNRSQIKRNAMMTKGNYKIDFYDIDSKIANSIKNYKPSEVEKVYQPEFAQFAPYVLNFGSNRDIKYKALDGIPRDRERDDFLLGDITLNGISEDDIKGWFANRYLYSKQTYGFTDIMQKNLALALNIFSLLDSSIEFKYIDPHSNDLILKTPNGDVYFEYLSSGYKTCMYIMLGILKEIEYRFSDIVYDKYDGLILIDEIDLHLHPTWQANIILAMKKTFPSSQIIVTTHSPSILQCLEKDEIIALDIDENNNVYQKDLQLGEYGLQGWTLEEILKDVMGMPSTTSQLYQDTINKFDEALDEENVEDIKKYYNLLLKMLHPNSVTRRLLQIQIAGFEE